jgi:hypothetical protein
MRSIPSLWLAYGLITVAGMTPAFAQLLPANQVRISKAFQTNPTGGKNLVSELSSLALENPANVGQICQMAKQGPLSQQYAAAAGLRRAYDVANSNGNAELAATIQSEVAQCGDASATAFAGGEAETGGSGARVAIPDGPLAVSVPVSPAKP